MRLIAFISLFATMLTHTSNGKLIPQSEIDKLLRGYSIREKRSIEWDRDHVHKILFSDATIEKEKIYLATVGAPLTRKTSTIEHYLHTKLSGKSFIYTDANARGLFLMSATYHAMGRSYFRYNKDSFPVALRNAYNHWSKASHALTYEALNKASQKGFSIAHGSSLTNTHISAPLLLESIKKEGYQIQLILCTAAREVRRELRRYREKVQANIQVNLGQFETEGLRVTRLLPTYLKFADKIFIHHTESREEAFDPAAEVDVKSRTITVFSRKKYNSFVDSMQIPGRKQNQWTAATSSFVTADKKTSSPPSQS